MSPVIERKNPSGKTVYGVRWTDEAGNDAKRFRASWTKEQAKAELSRLEGLLRDGVATRTTMTVRTLFAEWHANHVVVNCSPAYAYDAESNWRLRIEPMIGHRTIDTVNRRLGQQMVAEMQRVMRAKHPGKEYAGHATINKTMTILKGMFTYAVDVEQIPKNPFHGIPELTEEPTRQITAWPIEVIHQVALTAIRMHDELPDFQRNQKAPWAPERDYALIMLAALTGLRQSELLGRTWDRLDGLWLHVTHKLCRRSFTLRETKSKRGRRRVPLLQLTREIIECWRAVGAHDRIVFPNHEGTDFIRASHWDSSTWNKARKRASTVEHDGVSYDVAKLTFHELRHTFASECLAAGRDVWEVAHWLGDDPDLVKDVYGHYIPDSLGDTERLNGALSVSMDNRAVRIAQSAAATRTLPSRSLAP